MLPFESLGTKVRNTEKNGIQIREFYYIITGWPFFQASNKLRVYIFGAGGRDRIALIALEAWFDIY